MREQIPRSEFFNKEVIPEKKSMSEAETLAFLQENGVEPLGDDWQPGQPILYVLEEVIRGDEGPYDYVTASVRPSIVRLDSPTSLDFSIVSSRTAGRVVYPLLNETGGRVDFYAIDPQTKKISSMLIPRPPHESIRAKHRPFHVRKETLFKANDELFPPSTK